MTIVLAYARTAPGAAALEFAVAEAVARHDRLVLVSAEHDGPLAPADVATALGDHAATLAEAGLEAIADDSTLHDPSDRVIQAAQRHEARLIVLGLRQRSPVGKLLLGSTAQRILLDATCPVTSVKGE